MNATAELEEPLEGELLETKLDASQALMAFSRAEIDTQITTAKAYRRSIEIFQKNTMTMATLDQETAQTMFYALPRAGKTIKGPSVRMAEVVACNWGNLRSGARVVSIDDSFVTAQGTCHDLETNNAVSYECKRRITNKKGERFNDDMIQTTGNAACAIALREAIFKVVPRSLFKKIYEKAQLVAIGEARSMVQLRQDWFAYFSKMGVTKEQVLRVLERHGENDVTMEDLAVLTGLSTALKDGDATVEGTFGLRDDQQPKKAAASALKDKLSGNGNSSGAAQAGVDDAHRKAEPTGAVAPSAQAGENKPPDRLAELEEAILNCKDKMSVQAIRTAFIEDYQITGDLLAKVNLACDVKIQQIADKKAAGKQGSLVS